MTLESEDRVAAVVLAAGEAQRFGAPKLMMPFRGLTIIGCVVAALKQAQIDPIIVVAGTRTPEITEALKSTRAQIVRNPDGWTCEIMYDGGDGMKPLAVELSEDAQSDLDSAWTNIKSELIGAANTAEGL